MTSKLRSAGAFAVAMDWAAMRTAAQTPSPSEHLNLPRSLLEQLGENNTKNIYRGHYTMAA